MGIAAEWCCLQCGECKHFQVNADRREDTTCKRIDHKRIQFAVPWFKSYDCGQFSSGGVCADFEPGVGVPWLKEHWTGIEDYIVDWEKEERRSFFGKNNYVTLILDGNKDVRYRVRKDDYFYNRFLNDDGSLKWVEKYYYKRSGKSPTGYELVHEYRDGVK